jgi:rhodanese-related sulfurtransferase
MKRGLHAAVLFCLLAAFSGISCTAAVRPRLTRDVSADQLNRMLEQNRNILLVDTRTDYEYRQGRLPGAINIPPHMFDVLETLLPPDKTTEIVFYCRGVGCEPSKFAADAAARMGYQKARTFKAGFPAWVARGYRVEK